jgi:hypothetical protein
MASRDAAVPSAPRIWRTRAERAEAGWLAAGYRGMADPVVELWALDEADPGRVVIAVAGRERLALKLAQELQAGGRPLRGPQPDRATGMPPLGDLGHEEPLGPGRDLPGLNGGRCPQAPIPEHGEYGLSPSPVDEGRNSHAIHLMRRDNPELSPAWTIPGQTRAR